MSLSQSFPGAQRWFGEHLPAPDANPDEIRAVVRHSIRGIGYPHQEFLPAAPFLLPSSSYAELFHATDVLVGLLHRTALEIGADNAGRLAAYGADEQDYPLFLDPAWQLIEERYASCMVRPDVVVGPDGPKFLEFNISGGFAGVVESWCRYLAYRVLYGDGAGRLPYRYHDPFAARADLFEEVCADLDLPRRVAWVGTLAESVTPTTETRYFDVETDYLAGRGFAAEYVEVEDADRLWDAAPADRYPLGLRHFNTAELARLGQRLDPVRRALDNSCLLLATQTSGFLGNKKAMGLVSEGRPWMTAAEHAVVGRYLPWTRVLGDRRTIADGRSVELLPHVLAEQERLVLKRGIGSNGLQVLIGVETDPTTWREAVEKAAAAGDSVVQRFVPAQHCHLPVLGDAMAGPEVAKVAPVLSPFLFGRRPGGVYARFFADGAAGIISVCGHAASDTVAVTR
ncbi:hypothetical protein ATK36_4276 [Amycolatopsis sulphurea]|uniref:Circularly permuted ATP-grasp superfamily protein n=1 Tax=Amycolatopsis sulphurea TaxID=76022 RepID=A0A2A9FFD8_9PSEU|nr:hypothetical protein [Amycolatopsis sulphurea]PFG49145.1 hypothetical protein ATK36_4276 [Amycolatopsis sulphurea]